MRKLASIQTIQALEPIENADSIVRAKILGWWVVVLKDQFQVGDQVVYCEIDSYLPERPEFEFLRKSCWRAPIVEGNKEIMRGGFRIQTVRLRGQISQGICFPTSILEGQHEVGEDVTDLMGIEKYDPPMPSCLSGVAKGRFPSFIPKTDETRVQVLESVLARHQGKTFYVTEKVDGASVTVFLTGEQRGVCNRSLWLDDQDPKLTPGRIAHELRLFEKLEALSARTGIWYAVQGELLGPGIQKNRYGLKEAKLMVFNVLRIDPHGLGQLLPHWDMVDVAHELGLEFVPDLGRVELNHSVDQLVEMSRGKSKLAPNVHREGIVLRPLVEEQDPELGRLSFKAINPDFLIKYGE